MIHMVKEINELFNDSINDLPSIIYVEKQNKIWRKKDTLSITNLWTNQLFVTSTRVLHLLSYETYFSFPDWIIDIFTLDN